MSKLFKKFMAILCIYSMGATQLYALVPGPMPGARNPASTTSTKDQLSKYSVDELPLMAKMVAKDLKSFNAISIGSLENKASLIARVLSKHEKFKEGFFDLTQNHDNLLESLEPEAQELTHVYKKAMGLKNKVSLLVKNAKSLRAAHKAVLLEIYIQEIFLPLRLLSLQLMDFEIDNKTFLELNDELLFSFPKYIIDNGVVVNGRNILFTHLVEGLGSAILPFKLIEDGDNYHYGYDQERRLVLDITLLLKGKSALNYARGLKWYGILSTMKNIENAYGILGLKGKVNMPNSCQGQENGDFQSYTIIPDKNLEWKDMDYLKVLASNGILTAPLESIQELAFSNLSEDEKLQTEIQSLQSLVEQNIDTLTKTPFLDLEENLSGTMPFLDVESAKFALEAQYKDYEQPKFDDYRHFEFIYNELQPALLAKIEQMKTPIDPEKWNHYANVAVVGGTSATYLKAPEPLIDDATALKFLESITLFQPSKKTDSNNQDESEYIGHTNSVVQLLKKNNTTDILELLPSNTKKRLETEFIDFELPPYYSNNFYKQYAFKILSESITELSEKLPNMKKSFVFKRLFQLLFRKTKVKLTNYPKGCDAGPTCQMEFMIDYLSKLTALLAEYYSNSDLTHAPPVLTYNEEIRKSYPDIKLIWNFLEENQLIKNTKLSKYFYLESQYYAGNPWAKIKLSHYIIMSRLNSLEKKRYHQLLKKFKLDTDLKPFYGSELFNKKQNKYIWDTILYSVNNSNYNFFNSRSSRDKYYNYYELIQHISQTPLFTEDRLSGASEIFLNFDEVTNESDYKQRNAQLYNDPMLKSAQDLYEIFKTKDSLEKQDLAFKYFNDNKIDYTYSPKRHLLQADYYSKYHLYIELVRNSIFDYKKNLQKRLNDLCQMGFDDIENYKKLFHSTASIQKSFNDFAGIQEIPKAVTEKIQSLSNEEVLSLKTGLATVPSLIIMNSLAGCALTGPICPVALAVSFAATIFFTERTIHYEKEQYEISKGYEETMRKFQTIGYTDEKNLDQFHRGPWFMYAEIVLSLPLINYFSKALNTAQITLETIIKRASNPTYKSIKGVMVHAAEATNLKEQLSTMGLLSMKSEFKKFVTQPIKDLLIRKTNAKGINEGFVLSPLKRIEGLPTKKQLDHAMAKTLATHQKNDLIKFTKTLSRYRSGKSYDLLLRDKRRLAKRIQENELEISNLPTGISSKVKKLSKKLNLKVNKSSLKNIEFQLKLEQLITLAQSSASKGVSFEEFALKNMENLQFLRNLPWKLSEVPHMFILQGLPMTSRRVAFYENMIEGYMIKRFMHSYDGILSEILRNKTIAKAGISDIKPQHNTYDFVMSIFKKMDETLLNNKSIQNIEGHSLRLDLFKTELTSRLKLSSKIKSYLKENGITRNSEAFKELIFNPKNIEEKAVAETLWNSQSLDSLYRSESFKAYSYNMMKEFENAKSMDGFEVYFQSARMFFASKRPAMIF